MFRAKMNAQHSSKSSVIKWGHLLWGSVLLIASASIIVGFMALWPHTGPDSKPLSLRQQAMEKAEQAALEKVKERHGKSH